MARITKEALQNENEELKKSIKEKDSLAENIKKEHTAEIDNLKKQHEETLRVKSLEWQGQDKTRTEDHETKIKERDASLLGVQNELKETKIQLDRKELKKLAHAFSEQEDIHGKEQKRWLIALIIAVIVLFIYALVSIHLIKDKAWLDRIAYYLIDIILISTVWFCSAHFSDATGLKYDYGNRKTLAQSFQNILNNLAEDANIKNKFIEKTTDVLCAPVGIGSKEPVLSKKVLKDVAEIVGATVKH